MEDYLRHLFVQTLRAKLELCRVVAASLMESLKSPELTLMEKRTGFRLWVKVTREGDILAFILDLLRRHEREALEKKASQSFDD